ncbi:C1 family peptidase [Opitutus terrae]|uniref:C1 family peptidase n=1 Tax=Opitutus terrae TaxID=107709 RepID=UPI0002E9887A|nr:C1 family peptidase [Opitutus terrae]
MAATPPALGAPSSIPAGTHFDTFTVGAATYRDVKVRSVNARTVMITHSRGMTSIKLRDLSPEWQQKFGYDPATEAAAEQAIATPPSPPPSKPTARPAAGATGAVTAKLERLLRQFGEPATINAEVDLRPKYFQMELAVRSQGRRPSCAVFAIVSALEFQAAELTGEPSKLSEEYLSWATRKTVQRVVTPIAANAEGAENSTDAAGNADEGFSLNEVVLALRTYGVPLQSSMPNRFGRAISEIEDPAPAIVDEARTHQRVFVLPIPGRNTGTAVNNIVHALNAGIPIPIGVEWPHYRSIRTGSLIDQKPLEDGGHAVTLVGYRCTTNRLEDVVFIFKNSWGPDWGQGGYGTVTYGYLKKHLHSAVLLEVQRG